MARLPDVTPRLRLDDAHPRRVRAQLPVAGPVGELVELDGDRELSGELVGPHRARRTTTPTWRRSACRDPRSDEPSPAPRRRATTGVLETAGPRSAPARRARSRARSGSSTTGRASSALSQERDQLPVRARPRPREAPAVAERALREQLGLADARGRGCRREERLPRSGLVTRSGTGVAQQDQDLAAPPLVGPLLQRVEGHAEEPGGLLVGQRRHRLASSERRVLDRLRLVAERARLEVMVGDLGDERPGIARVGGFERGGDVGVPQAALAGRQVVVDGVADRACARSAAGRGRRASAR